MPAFLSAGSAAMHGALVPIASQTGNNSATSFAFNSIPQGYQDLMLVIYQRDFNGGNSSYGNSSIQFNSVGGTSYSTTTLYANGSSAFSGRVTNNSYVYGTYGVGSSATSGVYASNVLHILNYANTSTFKTVIQRGAIDLNGSGETELVVNLFRSTNAITSLTVFAYSGAPTSASTYTLYGVRTVGQ
jgi:hypothetical protein